MALHKEKKDKVVKDFRINDKDSGSTAVQVALLTEQIRELTNHLQTNKKDFSSKQGLLRMISRRNNFLKYMEKNDRAGYASLLKRLDLKG